MSGGGLWQGSTIHDADKMRQDVPPPSTASARLVQGKAVTGWNLQPHGQSGLRQWQMHAGEEPAKPQSAKFPWASCQARLFTTEPRRAPSVTRLPRDQPHCYYHYW